MFNEGDVLYAARDITFEDVFSDGNGETYYERGTCCTVTLIEDCGFGDSDFDWGIHFHVDFDMPDKLYPEQDTWRFSDISLFTKAKPE